MNFCFMAIALLLTSYIKAILEKEGIQCNRPYVWNFTNAIVQTIGMYYNFMVYMYTQVSNHQSLQLCLDRTMTEQHATVLSGTSNR